MVKYFQRTCRMWSLINDYRVKGLLSLFLKAKNVSRWNINFGIKSELNDTQGQTSIIEAWLMMHSLTLNLTSFKTFLSKTLYQIHCIFEQGKYCLYIVNINMVPRNTIIKCTMYPLGRIMWYILKLILSLLINISKDISHITCTS